MSQRPRRSAFAQNARRGRSVGENGECMLGTGPAQGSAVHTGWLSICLFAQVACNRPEQPFVHRAPPTHFKSEVTLSRPLKLRSIESGRTTPAGIPGRVPCETCHSLREDKKLPHRADELTQFHQGLQLKHGSIECSSCHAPGNPPALHLASGKRLPMVDALYLCAQCHGPQYRDYLHGAHGGMEGSWDLSRGTRTRNICVDCHDPHTPQIPVVTPAPPPHDRFMSQNEAGIHEP